MGKERVVRRVTFHYNMVNILVKEMAIHLVSSKSDNVCKIHMSTKHRYNMLKYLQKSSTCLQLEKLEEMLGSTKGNNGSLLRSPLDSGRILLGNTGS